MIRICGTREVRLVAAITRGWQCRVVVIDMALRAWNRGVRSRQRERRSVVIERGLCPQRRVMAHLAGRREPGCCVIRIVRPGVVRFVARVTIRWHRRVVVIHVALRARNRGVRSGQRECAC